MADFKTHMMGAALISGVAATALLKTGTVTNQAAVGYFTLGVAGGLLPDIDSDTSIPIRIAFTVLAVACGFLLIFAFGDQLPLLGLMLLGLAGYLVIRYGLFHVFTRLTVHRGLIHSIPAGVIAGLATTLLAYRFFDTSAALAWSCGAFVLLGFVVHLLLDEFYSVNLMGMKVKRSFGTAFNLGSTGNLLGTAAMYIAIAVLLYVNPPVDGFVATVINDDTYRPLLDQASSLLSGLGTLTEEAFR